VSFAKFGPSPTGGNRKIVREPMVIGRNLLWYSLIRGFRNV
jgi:hypothetical protein